MRNVQTTIIHSQHVQPAAGCLHASGSLDKTVLAHRPQAKVSRRTHTYMNHFCFFRVNKKIQLGKCFFAEILLFIFAQQNSLSGNVFKWRHGTKYASKSFCIFFSMGNLAKDLSFFSGKNLELTKIAVTDCPFKRSKFLQQIWRH